MQFNVIFFLVIFFIFSFCLSGSYCRVDKTVAGGINQTYKRFVLFSFLSFFCFFYVLRDFSYAHDTALYVAIYKDIAQRMHSITDYRIASNMERGFIVLVYLLSRICSNGRFFLLVISLFIYGSFMRFIYRYTRRLSICRSIYAVIFFVLLGTYFSSTNIMRQYIAISIILFAYPYALEKKYLHYYFLVLLAFFFHISSIICVFIPFVHLLKINKRILFFYLIVLFILAAFGTRVLSIVLHYILPRYEHFLTNSIYGIQSSVKLGPLLNFSIDFLLFFLFYRNLAGADKVYEFFLKNFMVALLFTAVSLKFTQIGRMSSYFSPAAIPLFALVKRNTLFYLILFALVGYCLVINILRPEWTAFFPYSFI